MNIVKRICSFAARGTLGTVTHVATNQLAAALTFDDGPDAEYTLRLLHILEKHGARGTFFITGEAAQRHPDLVQRIALGGHCIGNHSWSHPSFPLISGKERRAEIRACARATAPYEKRLFRPPYGDQNILSRLDAMVLGYQVIMFDVATDDWCGQDGISIAQQLERRIRPGSIVVLHDRLSDAIEATYFNREPVLDAVEVLLQRLDQRFRFVTVPELLRCGRAHKEFWYKQPDLELLNKLTAAAGPARRYPAEKRSSWWTSMLGRLVEMQAR